jgi:hypothetical protein
MLNTGSTSFSCPFSCMYRRCQLLPLLTREIRFDIGQRDMADEWPGHPDVQCRQTRIGIKSTPEMKDTLVIRLIVKYPNTPNAVPKMLNPIIFIASGSAAPRSSRF